VAGVEWYDSGIGFAIPLEHVNYVLPRLKAGEDLHPGIMGVSFSGKDMYGQPATIVTCRPNSPAAKAGLKAGDRIIEIDGQPIERQVQLRQQINRRYAGDTLRVVVMRGEERIPHEITLVDHLDPYQRAFLGVLPMRELSPVDAHTSEKPATDKTEPEKSSDKPADKADASKPVAKPVGVVVRYVYPDSPAAKAGLKAGDKIVSIDGAQIANRDALLELSGGD
jgi:serine protease Do